MFDELEVGQVPVHEDKHVPAEKAEPLSATIYEYGQYNTNHVTQSLQSCSMLLLLAAQNSSGRVSGQQQER